MTDENPYRAPLASGQALHPNTWLRRGWSDVPGLVAAVIGILMMTFGVVSGIAMAASGSPGTGVVTGLVCLVWALLWFAAAQAWWKGYLISSLVWTGLALAPIWVMLASAFWA